MNLDSAMIWQDVSWLCLLAVMRPSFPSKGGSSLRTWVERAIRTGKPAITESSSQVSATLCFVELDKPSLSPEIWAGWVLNNHNQWVVFSSPGNTECSLLAVALRLQQSFKFKAEIALPCWPAGSTLSTLKYLNYWSWLIWWSLRAQLSVIITNLDGLNESLSQGIICCSIIPICNLKVIEIWPF